MLFVAIVCERLTIIALDENEYVNMVYSSGGRPAVMGGAIYDAILATCALKAGVEGESLAPGSTGPPYKSAIRRQRRDPAPATP